MAEVLEFKPYSLAETKDVLMQRAEYAFAPGVFDNGALAFKYVYIFSASGENVTLIVFILLIRFQ